jgi:hypothetical protein
MFYRSREHRVRKASESSSEIVLAIRESSGVLRLQVSLLEGSASVVESTELNGNTGPDADEWGQSAFVECEGPFILEDGARTGEGVGVGCCCLEADFYYVWGKCEESRLDDEFEVFLPNG